MIAKNFRMYPDAQLLQLELDLAGVIDAPAVQRDAWWFWLMRTATVLALPKPAAPEWFVAFKRRALALARSVKARLMTMF